MLKKFKFKFYAYGMIFLFLPCLTSCKTESVVTKYGYTQKVVYDLGDGVYNPEVRNTHTLDIYYQPGSYITDFKGSPKYVFKMPLKEGEEGVKYELEGWFFDKEFTQEVNFQEYTLPTTAGEEIRIYAKWEAIFDKHFEIYFLDDDFKVMDQSISLKWEMNKAFYYVDEIVHPKSETTQYTYIDAYKDKEMTQPVDSSYVLTKTSDGLPIYTKWIEGNYKVVNDVKGLQEYLSACAKNAVMAPNFYLNADVDASEIDTNNYYIKNLVGKTFLGNNHTIYNWYHSTLKGDTINNAVVGGFVDSMTNCVIKDLNFVDANFVIDSKAAKYVYFATLAGKIVNSTIENVHISGKYIYSQDVIDRLALNDDDKKQLKEVKIKDENIGYSIDENSKINNCSVEIESGN